MTIIKHKNLVVICLLSSSIIVSYFTYLFLFNGITVDYQRTTGPDFIVIEGDDILRKEYLYRNDLKYNEIYVDIDIDNSYGYLNQGPYIIVGKAKGTKCIESSCKEKFPNIQIEWIVSKVTFILLEILTLAMGLFYGLYFIKCFNSEKKNI